MSAKLNISPKAKKIINIAVNVVCGIILIFVLILAISMIQSKRKNYGNYTEIFGKAYLAVQSNSMSEDAETGEVGSDNFSKGDLITVTIIKDDSAKKSLKVGDVITFRTTEIVAGKWVLNTHRIQSIQTDDKGKVIYVTHGDNNPENMVETVESNLVIGKLAGIKPGGGKIVTFMGSSAGFFVFVVLPTFIIVAYAAINLVVVIMREKKAQAAAGGDKISEDERERIRQELLAEMQAQNSVPQPEAVARTEGASVEKTAEESEESIGGGSNPSKTEKNPDSEAGAEDAGKSSSDGEKE